MKFKVYEFEELLRLVQERINIGGKVRVVVEFQGQPRTIPIELNNVLIGLKNSSL